MGCSIYLHGAKEHENISPGWNKQMAKWLWEISDKTVKLDEGYPYTSAVLFEQAEIPMLEYHREHQRKGIEQPPYDTSEHWTACFNKIIEEIKQHGQAIVEINW